jgi:hippurate hydrolase
MPINPAIEEFVEDAREWRRDIHQNPELLYDVDRTSAFVAEKLKAFGCDEVATGIGRTGVVGVIRGRLGSSDKAIGLRADMDALPIHETTNLPYRSKIEGKMHACGHDGHTAMLLGAARYLAKTRNFAGSAIVIFQPAEEGGAGAKAMIEDGLMDRFGVAQVFGMHNMPKLPVGSFALRKGPFFAAGDRFTIEIEGQGGHAAYPHHCVDPLLAGAQIVNALQAIVSRGVDPLDSCVVSVTRFEAGANFNVTPQSAQLLGTVRTFSAATQNYAERRLIEIARGVAAAFGAKVEVRYERGYPAMRNHPDEADFAASVAAKIAGADKVHTDTPPIMGAEDFSFMLEARRGAFIMLGNGDSAGLHDPKYDFNDAALPYGMTYWAQLVETALAA